MILIVLVISLVSSDIINKLYFIRLNNIFFEETLRFNYIIFKFIRRRVYDIMLNRDVYKCILLSKFYLAFMHYEIIFFQ